MGIFKGFSEGSTLSFRIPEPIITEIIPRLDHLDDLVLTLYIFWKMEKIEGSVHFLIEKSIFLDPFYHKYYPNQDTNQIAEKLKESIDRLMELGVILIYSYEADNSVEELLFLNSTRSRAAIKAIKNGDWIPGIHEDLPSAWITDQEPIFSLYEQNIGIITPLIAEALADAENSFPEIWIREAIQIAAERNKRSWKYIEAILIRWEKGGRFKSQSSDPNKSDWRKYIEGEYSDYIEH